MTDHSNDTNQSKEDPTKSDDWERRKKEEASEDTRRQHDDDPDTSATWEDGKG